MQSLTKRAVVYGLCLVLGLLAVLPNVLPECIAHQLPDWYSQQTLSLGLDLRGGSQLLLALDETTLLQQEHQRLADEAARLLREQRIGHGQISVSDRQFSLPLRDSQRAQEAVQLLQPVLEQGTLSRAFSISAEGSRVLVAATDSHRKALLDDAVERSLEVVRRRLDESGLVEPSITRQGRDSILVQMPGVEDPAQIRALLGTTAQLNFHWVADSRSNAARIQRPLADGSQTLWLEREVAMAGEHVRDAQLGFNAESGQPVVNFRLDSAGTRIFGDLTQANVGRALAIVLDNRVITAPVIRSVIAGGQGEISGAFTSKEASEVALLLRSGALPAPLDVVEERTIGPDLGSDAISMGLTTGLLGAALVLAFMLLAYGRWGLLASVTLSLNVMLIFAVLTVLGATLTLPGIAGLILTIGMAVDANILINERIREESRNGRSPQLALKLGFDRAYRTIVDANVTTLIAVGLLFLFGTGPVRGFAVTIGIGLLTSMFTAIAVTRLLLELGQRRRPQALAELPLQRWLQRLTQKPLNIMRGRVLGLGLSVLLSVASLVLLVQPGLNYGIDFRGGTLLETHLPQVPTDQLREALEQQGFSQISLQELGGDGEYLLRLPLAAEGGHALADAVKSSLQAQWPEAEFPRLEMVGAKVSGQFADVTILAVLLAVTGMLGYLWLRFESHFALAATLTVLLDVTKTIGFFVLTGLDFNLTAVAALLALIGYSVNDKVVVFDRVRETLRAQPGMDWPQVLNDSITATLSRTVFTSVTTALALLPMAIAGGAAVASFAQPMLFGVVVGTLSSIFVASSILYYLGQRRQRLGLAQLRPTDEEIQQQLQLMP
ncbi:protein translocase subunit SecD [Venatoribacter cucullus]|uniref:protein translocase subunit SecD n=1 Tax=Venatoribacter cucullus TaxID=2661630 RepID=UPI00223ED871|nr:protein translocase subunit SecD [Venatoribacter cucullus]UZK02756.1 protein translocase subunit SecD [Venatoribacter cucullus]